MRQERTIHRETHVFFRDIRGISFVLPLDKIELMDMTNSDDVNRSFLISGEFVTEKEFKRVFQAMVESGCIIGKWM